MAIVKKNSWIYWVAAAGILWYIKHKEAQTAAQGAALAAADKARQAATLPVA